MTFTNIPKPETIKIFKIFLLLANNCRILYFLIIFFNLESQLLIPYGFYVSQKLDW